MKATRILTLNIGVNLGNQDTKSVGLEGVDIFSSLATYNHRTSVSIAGTSDDNDKNCIYLDEVKCLVQIGEASYGDFKFRNDNEIKTLGMLAIAKQLQKRKDLDLYGIVEVHMCVGLPIKEFREPKNHQKLNKIFSGDTLVKYLGKEIIVRFKPNRYDNNNVLIVPEGFAYYAAFKAEKGYADFRKILVLDYGSRTIDYVKLVDGTSVDGDSIPDAGTISLMDMIRLRGGDIEKLENIQLDRLLKEGFVNASGKTYKKEDFEEEIRLYAENAHKKIIQIFGDLSKFDKIIIIGGGSYLVGDFFKENYPENILDIPSNAEFANANAYYNLSYME